MHNQPPFPARILIVSDRPDNCEWLEKSLSGEVCDIRSFCSIRVALKSVAESEPDLIVLDLSQTDSTSHEVCRQLKSVEKSRALPVLMLTSLNEVGAIEQAVRAGCDDFLTRPLNEQELRSRSHALIRVKKLREEAKRRRDELSG